MKLNIAFAMLILVVACNAASAPKLADLQCRGCVAAGGRWCATSTKTDADGTCLPPRGPLDFDRRGRCHGTTITTVETCPTDIPASKKTCTACSGDGYVWCQPREDIMTFVPLQPMCIAMPKRDEKADEKPIPVEPDAGAGDRPVPPKTMPDGDEVHIPEHDMPDYFEDASEEERSESESDSDSDSESEDEDNSMIPESVRPPPLRRQNAFFLTSEQDLDDFLAGHKRVCPREYRPVYTTDKCTSAPEPKPTPTPQPKPTPVPTPDGSSARSRVRKWFKQNAELSRALAVIVSGVLFAAICVCCAHARRRRLQRLQAAAQAYSPLGPQHPVNAPYPPGGAGFDGFPGNYNPTHGMLVAEPVSGMNETVVNMPPRSSSSSSSSSAGYPRGIPVTAATVATNAVQAIPVPDNSRPMAYATPMYAPMAPRQAEQQLLPRGYAGHVPQPPMQMATQAPVYRVTDLPSGPREQQPPIQLQVGIPVHQSQPAVHYAPSAPPAPMNSGRDLEMSLLPRREAMASAPAAPAPSRMYPQLSHDGYMRLE